MVSHAMSNLTMKNTRVKFEKLKIPSTGNIEIFNVLRSKLRKTIRKEKMVYGNKKIRKLQNNYEFGNVMDFYGGTRDQMKGYQRKTTMLLDENGILITTNDEKWKHIL